MNTDNKVRTEPPHQEVDSPPMEPATTPDVSPAINGAADDQQHHQAKERAQSQPIESPKNSEKSYENSQAAEDTDDRRSLKTYGKAVEQDAPSIVTDQLKVEVERIQKIPGFSCSHQQTLTVPGMNNFYLTVTLFTIIEGVSMSKLVKSEDGGT